MALNTEKFDYKIDLTDAAKRANPNESIVDLAFQDLTNVSNESPTSRANKFIRWSNSGNTLEFVTSSGGGGLNSGTSFPSNPSNNDLFLLTAVISNNPVGIYQYVNNNWVARISSGTTTFLGLTDTPASLGTAGQYLAVNSGATALEFRTLPNLTPFSPSEDNLYPIVKTLFTASSGIRIVNDDTNKRIQISSTINQGATTLIALTDFPNSFSGEAGRILQVNSAENALEFVDKPTGGGGGGGATTFLALTDVPSAFGTAGQVLKVNSSRTGLIFADDSTGGGGGATTFIALSDTPSAFTGQGGKFLAVNSGATAVEFVDAPTGGGGGTSPTKSNVYALLKQILQEGTNIDFTEDDTDNELTINYVASTPSATNITITQYFTANPTGTLSGGTDTTIAVGADREITRPQVTGTGLHWVIEVPTGYEITEIKDAHFHNISFLSEFTRSGQIWYYTNALNPSPAGQYLITIEES